MPKLSIKSRLRLARWWVLGYTRCLDSHESGEAFCKRRPRHLGKHRTGNRRLKWG